MGQRMATCEYKQIERVCLNAHVADSYIGGRRLSEKWPSREGILRAFVCPNKWIIFE